MNALPLRRWQQSALSNYLQAEQRIYTCHATPASGKTQYGLAVAVSLLKAGEIKQLVVLCHTKQIRQQWIAAAAAVGLTLSTRLSADSDGYIFSYQQLVDAQFVAHVNPLIRGRRRSLVILDEPHHLAAAKAWGSGTRETLKSVHRMLLLSGTLFRHDEGTIPFVTYASGILAPDFEYSYTAALREQIVGPIYFPTFGGQTEWQFEQKPDAAVFGEAASDRRLARQLNTAIASEDWLSSVIRTADDHLERIRVQDPTAGGLIVAKNQPHARSVAQLVEAVTGAAPEIALSEIAKSEQVISDFAEGKAKWIVAVKMISEGVDIPRLRIGIYASNILTELFFRQVVGRLVRTHPPFASQDAYLYIPRHPVLLAYAESIAEERYHVLSEQSVETPTSSGVKEVFGQLEPGLAVAEPGEMLNPLGIEVEGDLLALLQSGFAALDAAERQLQQARHCFEQVAAKVTTAPRPVARFPGSTATTLRPPESQLLSAIAVHRQATVNRVQLISISGLEKMNFYDCLAALTMAGYVEEVEGDECVSITADGLLSLGADIPGVLRSGGDVIRLWSMALTKREAGLLQGLLKGAPDWLERQRLVQLAGYSKSAAGKIGVDLKRLVAFSLAQSNRSGQYRLNPNLLETPFSGY